MVEKSMNINKILWIFSISILAFGLSYFISGYSLFKYTIPTLNNIGVTNVKKIGSRKNNNKLIYEKNIFDLELDEKKSNNVAVNGTQKVSNDFKGKLLGLIKENKKEFAVIKIGKDIMILEKGKEKEGYLFLGFSDESIILKFNGKTYLLKFEKNNTNSIKLNTTSQQTQKVLKPSDKIIIEGNKITVPREVFVTELNDINKVLRSVLVSPSYKNGKFMGYRVSRLKRDSIFRKIGIINGDIIVKINGELLTTPEKLFEFFAKTEDITAVTVDLIRYGKKKSLYIEID
jgi:general secretion pathway protein C